MDDHEILNDYDGKTVDPARYAAGRQAFLEWMPIRETGLPHDPSCAGDPLYRTVKWGKDVELFITDQRSCRDADVEAICQRRPRPDAAGRTAGGVPVQPVPDADTRRRAAVTAINDPNRTMLGPVQKAKFKDGPPELDREAQDRDQRARMAAVLRAAVRPLGGLRR